MLLSICIPTFSRNEFLINMIRSVGEQIEFNQLQDKVEIIISDNCSFDETESKINNLISSGKTYIRYFKNEKNIGVVRNLMQTIKYANGRFWMFYGDDDLMSPNALPTILDILEKNKDIPVFVFKQRGYNLINETSLKSIYQCAELYFYYMGNACSVMNTSSAKQELSRYYDSIISTCWPQTHLMFLCMYSSALSKPVLVCNVEVYQSQLKDDNNILNPFYVYDSTFYSLIRLGYTLSQQKDKLFYRHIKRGIPNMNGKKYWQFCRMLFQLNKFYSTKKERDDFRVTLNESLFRIKGVYKLFILPIWLLNLLPGRLVRIIYYHSKSLYYFLARKNNLTYMQNYLHFVTNLNHLRNERFNSYKKKHAIIINRGDW